MVAPVAGLSVLDLATGTGAFAAALLALPGGAPTELLAVDRVPEMVDRARTRLDGTGAVVMRADARELPWRGRFDLVAMAYVLHLMGPEDAVAVLASARRALRPGGRVVVVEHAVREGLPGRVYRRLWALGGLLVSGALGTGPIGDARPLFTPAGLDVLDARRVVLGYPSQIVIAGREGGSLTELSHA